MSVMPRRMALPDRDLGVTAADMFWSAGLATVADGSGTARSRPHRWLERGTSCRLRDARRGLEIVQVGDGPLRMGGGREDETLVVRQHLELSAAAHNVKERGQIG